MNPEKIRSVLRAGVVTAVIIALLVAVAAFYPPLRYPDAGELADSDTVELTGDTAETAVLDLQAVRGNDARPGDHLRVIPATASESIAWEKIDSSGDDDLLEVTSTDKLTSQGETLWETTATARQDAENGYATERESQGRPTDSGMQIPLPPGLSKRSIPLIDPVLGTVTPLDYRSELDPEGDLPTRWTFAQDIAPTSIDGHFDIPDLRLPAGQLYTPAELDRYGYAHDQDVSVQPYYSASRSWQVEPYSGVVLDRDEEIYVFYAASQQQAVDMAADKDNYSQQRTILRHSARLDEASRHAQIDRSADTVAAMTTGRVLVSVAELLIAVVLIIGVVVIVRRVYAKDSAAETS